MQRVAFKMKLLTGFENEYQRRHDEIWPDLKDLLKDTGITNYSIFLDLTTNSLFGIFSIQDLRFLDRLPEQTVMKRWWEYMADIMETNPDYSPKQISLQEVFYLP